MTHGWTEQCLIAFEALKGKLTSAPVLAYADFPKTFILEVDASHGGLRAVLSQEFEGKIRPIAYVSRSLRQGLTLTFFPRSTCAPKLKNLGAR